MNAIIAVNNSCNLKCKMCSFGQRDFNTSGIGKNWRTDNILTPDQWETILKQCNATSVHIQGVEPLLYPHLSELLQRISKFATINLTTNGFLINDYIDDVIKYCNLTTISIDGSTEFIHDNIRGVKGSFDRAFNGIKYIAAHKPKGARISFAIGPDNYLDIYNMYQLMVNDLQIPVIFNHYNYIHPTSCIGYDIPPSNLNAYDPSIIDTDLLFNQLEKCKFKARCLPGLTTKQELHQYYKTAPINTLNKQCSIINGIINKNRVCIVANGDYIISSRCWMTCKLGNALTENLEQYTNKVLQLQYASMPAPCQRLCCSGKTV